MFFAKDNALSKSIIEYYLNHGRNRDLERFLRLRSRSSSNISDISEEFQINEKIVSKSMENLKLTNKITEKVSPGFIKTVSQPETEKGSDKTKESSKTEPHNIKVKLKHGQKEKHNFNVESIIEINFSAHNPPQILSSDSIQPMSSQCELKPISYSTDTQTQQNESTSMETSNVEDPIQPTLQKLKTNSPKSINHPEQSISPSSVASENKQKLEWDSLGDLGEELYL